ncbi:hypothetical protein TNCV_2666901 [Trichonephila clavipes]|nr:hypothetical protein TNCV_2666901 [Trichonephila clavipes]
MDGLLHESPVKVKIVRGPPVKKNQVNEYPAIGNQVNGSPAIENQVNGSPAIENQVNGSPAIENQVNGSPAIENQVNGSPAIENQVNGSPAIENQVNGSPATENQANGSPATENQANGSPATENQANGSPATENQANGSPATENQANGSPATENQANGSPATENQANGSPATENQANGSPATENQANGSPATENQANGSPVQEKQISGVSKCIITYLSDHAFKISFPIEEFEYFPKFLASNECRPLCSTWKVTVYMYPPRSVGAFLLRVKLTRLDHRPSDIKACMVVAITDNQNNEICKMKNDSTFFPDNCIVSATMCTRVPCGKDWPKPNCSLNVEVSTYNCCKDTSDLCLFGKFDIYVKPPTPEMNAIQLQSDLLSAYDSGLLEDVEISHLGDIIKASKFILGARTTYFFHRFEDKRMKDGIHEFHKFYGARTIKAFLNFLYTEWLEEDLTLDMIIQLRQISFYYGVNSLWDLCEDLLISNMNLDTWYTIYGLTYLFEDPLLKKNVHKFVRDHEKEISSRTDWKDRLKQKDRLYTELCLEHRYIINLELKDQAAKKEQEAKTAAEAQQAK